MADETDDGWGEWAASTAHDGLARGFLSRFAPSKNQIKTAGAVVANTANGVANLFRKSGSDQIISLPMSEARHMTDVDGGSLTLDNIYAAHPLMKDVLLKSEVLHSYILKEQRAQIIRFFRSSVALKSLTIEIASQSTGKFYAGGGWKLASASADRDTATEQRHWFTATYTNPQRENLVNTESLFWMPHFDELTAATHGAAGGTIESITTLNTSFGISAAAASLANIDTNWISNQSFIIKAEYI